MRPSKILRIEDETTALDFDLACTSRLLLFDAEKEKRMIEAMAAGAAMNTMQGMTAGLGASKNTPKPNANLPRQ